MRMRKLWGRSIEDKLFDDCDELADMLDEQGEGGPDDRAERRYKIIVTTALSLIFSRLGTLLFLFSVFSGVVLALLAIRK